MLKDRLISESCDFGVVYSLYARGTGTSRSAVVKISWEEETSDGEPKTCSCVFEIDFERGQLVALGRKGNQLPAEKFPGARICNWARRDWSEFLDE